MPVANTTYVHAIILQSGVEKHVNKGMVMKCTKADSLEN